MHWTDNETDKPESIVDYYVAVDCRKLNRALIEVSARIWSRIRPTAPRKMNLPKKSRRNRPYENFTKKRDFPKDTLRKTYDRRTTKLRENV